MRRQPNVIVATVSPRCDAVRAVITPLTVKGPADGTCAVCRNSTPWKHPKGVTYGHHVRCTWFVVRSRAQGLTMSWEARMENQFRPLEPHDSTHLISWKDDKPSTVFAAELGA